MEVIQNLPDLLNSGHQCILIHSILSKVYVISTVFESKDKPTQMTKQSFTIVDFITYRKSIHFELICKDVHD